MIKKNIGVMSSYGGGLFLFLYTRDKMEAVDFVLVVWQTGI